MLAPTPTNQPDRLAAIDRFELGAQRHGDAFDGIVELAAQICGCPIALVSIVRAEDQTFEARCGMEAAGTGLDASVCSYAILQPDVFEVPDMRLDPRTSDNPLVTDPDDPLLFYAGAPIVTPEGIALGSLCVLDRRPRKLAPEQRRGLQVLAEQVMQRLLLHDALRQKDLLRREVDHRVKNNLANVAVLTRMAARGAKGEEAREALASVERRIRVMVELHSDLYAREIEAEGDARIDIPDFLGRIVGHLAAIAPDGVRLDGRFDPIQLRPRRASALGILVNELVSNACKHGFPDGREGTIRLRGQAVGGGRYLLTCEDDGVGSGSDAPSDGGLGLQIAQASATQVGGALEIGPHAGSGWRAALSFPCPRD